MKIVAVSLVLMSSLCSVRTEETEAAVNQAPVTDAEKIHKAPAPLHDGVLPHEAVVDALPHEPSRSSSKSTESVTGVHVDADAADGAMDKDGNAHRPDMAHLVEDANEFRQFSFNFWHAFAASFSVIFVSEIGDKTFFIAAILAMRHSRTTVFAGALGALGLMTVLSAFLGYATQIIPRKITYYVSTALFALFGLKMLKDGYYMSPNEGQEEYEDAQAEVKKTETEYERQFEPEQDPESGVIRQRRSLFRMALRFVSRTFFEAFTLTFVAEWGDRSQLTTILLAARENVVGVIIGGTLGHAICTGIAVLGGRMIAQSISARTVTLIGGVVFIIFALSALVVNPDAE